MLLVRNRRPPQAQQLAVVEAVDVVAAVVEVVVAVAAVMVAVVQPPVRRPLQAQQLMLVAPEVAVVDAAVAAVAVETAAITRIRFRRFAVQQLNPGSRSSPGLRPSTITIKPTR